MSANLETRINQPNQYSSAGERKIAEILTKYGIPFKYESPVLVQDDQNKPRIWYPDFFLPEYGIYIEYYGLEGDPEYDRGTAKKNATYVRNGIETISVYGTKNGKNLEGDLVDRIYRVLDGRFRQFGQRISRTGLLPSTGGNQGTGNGSGHYLK